MCRTRLRRSATFPFRRASGASSPPSTASSGRTGRVSCAGTTSAAAARCISRRCARSAPPASTATGPTTCSPCSPSASCRARKRRPARWSWSFPATRRSGSMSIISRRASPISALPGKPPRARATLFEEGFAMPLRLDRADPDFETRFAAFLATKREVSDDVDAVVRDIIARIRAEGDAALIDYTARFDRLELTPATIRIGEAEIDAAMRAVDPDTLAALKLAHERIASHHARQMPKDDRYTDAAGVELGSRWSAVEAVGLYVPGGTASYPSSVLMNAVPAKVAGVERIVITVPSPGGVLNPLVLAAARLAGVSEIYRVGGAQAVAALAYGTETITPVAKIVGPGNAFVAAAKRRVFGAVGIDMIAGPSEVLVIADGANDPAWLAADLIAQA